MNGNFVFELPEDLKMKKIINGKLYNTETARLIGHYNNGYYSSDFNYCAEELYQKKNGEYFLYGCGGALSAYGEHRGNEMCWGDCIMPMTAKEARSWAEEYLPADKYMELFGAEE